MRRVHEVFSEKFFSRDEIRIRSLRNRHRVRPVVVLVKDPSVFRSSNGIRHPENLALALAFAGFVNLRALDGLFLGQAAYSSKSLRKRSFECRFSRPPDVEKFDDKVV